MSFFKIQAASLAQAMAQARENALIERVGEVLGKKVDREAVAQLGKDGRITAISHSASAKKSATYLIDGRAILFVGEPKIKFTGTEISAAQEIRRL